MLPVFLHFPTPLSPCFHLLCSPFLFRFLAFLNTRTHTTTAQQTTHITTTTPHHTQYTHFLVLIFQAQWKVNARICAPATDRYLASGLSKSTGVHTVCCVVCVVCFLESAWFSTVWRESYPRLSGKSEWFERVVLNLFANFKRARSSGYCWRICCASDDSTWAIFGKQKNGDEEWTKHQVKVVKNCSFLLVFSMKMRGPIQWNSVSQDRTFSKTNAPTQKKHPVCVCVKRMRTHILWPERLWTKGDFSPHILSSSTHLKNTNNTNTTRNQTPHTTHSTHTAPHHTTPHHTKTPRPHHIHTHQQTQRPHSQHNGHRETEEKRGWERRWKRRWGMRWKRGWKRGWESTCGDPGARASRGTHPAFQPEFLK